MIVPALLSEYRATHFRVECRHLISEAEIISAKTIYSNACIFSYCPDFKNIAIHGKILDREILMRLKATQDGEKAETEEST